MTRLAVSAEGATEREFINRVLKPHLLAFGYADVVGIDLQGNVSLDKIRGVLPGLLGSFDRVSTLYDFYGFKRRDGRDVESLELAIGALVEDERSRRLLPYIQRYEFEALLFAVPEQTCSALQGTDVDMRHMLSIVAEKGSPELVNDRLESSPSHRLKALFPAFDKKLHGPDIVAQAGLAAVRSRCERFNSWVARLEQHR